MLGQRPRVVLGAQLMQQLRRTLDVREEKRHRAGREILPHPPILSRMAAYPKPVSAAEDILS